MDTRNFPAGEMPQEKQLSVVLCCVVLCCVVLCCVVLCCVVLCCVEWMIAAVMVLSIMCIPFLHSTFMPVFPPAGGLPVIKDNTPGQNVNFFALFSALFFHYFSFRRKNLHSCYGSRAFAGTHRNGSAGKRLRNLVSVCQKNLFSLTIFSCQPIRNSLPE